MRRRGPIYDLEPGLRLWDVDGGCGACGKRLAEVIEDVNGQWRPGQLVCIDCGWIAPAPSQHEVKVKPYFRGGLVIAFCSCKWRSNAGSRAEVGLKVEQHRAQVAA